MKCLLFKKKTVLVLVGLAACFLIACGKKEDEKLANSQEVVDIEKTEEVSNEYEKEEEIEEDEESVDPAMEKVALCYLQAINDYPASDYGVEYLQYGLVNISSSGYPQLLMNNDYDEESNCNALHLFNADGTGRLIDLGEYGCSINYVSGISYYENQDVFINSYNDRAMPGMCVYYLEEDGYKWRYWTYSFEEVYDETNGYDYLFYTYWIDENGFQQESEHNKTYEQCMEEYDALVSNYTGEPDYLESSEFLTKDEMIDYLKSFLSKSSLEKLEYANTPQIEEIQSAEARNIYRTLIDNIFAREEMIQDTTDGFYYGDNYNPDEYNAILEFALIDITGDGTPEFFLNVKEGDRNSWGVYTIKNGDYKKADFGEFGRIHGYMPDTNSIYVSSGYGGDQVYKVNDGRIEIDYSFTCDYDDNLEPTQYYREDANGITPITMDEYDNAIAELESYPIVGLELNEENINKYFN